MRKTQGAPLVNIILLYFGVVNNWLANRLLKIEKMFLYCSLTTQQHTHHEY